MAAEDIDDFWLPENDDQVGGLTDKEWRVYRETLRLTTAEKWLVQKLIAGKWADFGFSSSKDGSATRQDVRAEVLMALINGCLYRKRGDAQETVELPATGVRVRNARFVDGANAIADLRLDDMLSGDVARSLSLALEACVFSGLDLTNSRLARLSLNGSRLARGGCGLIFNNAVFAGPVTICDFSAERPGDPCTLVARDASVEGSLRLRHSIFEGKPRDISLGPNAAFEDRSDVAVDLERTRVGGSVDASGARLGCMTGAALVATRLFIGGDLKLSVSRGQPFTSNGVLGLGGARIEGNCILDGAQLTALESTILAQSLTIGGSLTGRSFNSSGGRLRFTSAGRLHLHQCKIGGNLEFVGAELRAPAPADERGELSKGSSLYLRNATIEGDVKLEAGTSEGSNQLRFQSRGTIVLEGAKVGGAVFVRGAEIIAPEATNYAFSASHLVVAGDMRVAAHLGVGFAADGALNLSDAQIAGELTLKGVRLDSIEQNALLLVGAKMGQLRITPDVVGGEMRQSSIAGSINLSGATIERELTLFGVVITTKRRTQEENHEDGVAIYAREASIKGSTRLGARSKGAGRPEQCLSVRGQIDFVGARFGSDLELLNLELTADRESLSWSNMRPALTLEGAAISGALEVTNLSVESRKQGIVDLRGCSCRMLDDDGGSRWLGDDVGRKPQLLLNHFVYASASRLSGDKLPGIRRRISRLAGKSDACFSRERWLRQQYDADHPTARAFAPQPWAQAFKAFRDEGAVDDARKLAITKLGIEARLLRSGWLPFGWTRCVVSWFEEILFGFGLSAKRALASTTIILLLGWWGVHYANSNAILVVDATPIASVVPQGRDVILPQLTSTDQVAGDLPCGDTVNEFFYAVDVFIPLVDLRQESRCQVRSPTSEDEKSKAAEIRLWTAAKALFSLLGWISVSMTILTLSGVFRRNVES
jgi:hypothetical protein